MVNDRQSLDLTTFAPADGGGVEWRISPKTVPYPEAVRLHEALARMKVPNQLVTVPGGGHGGFTPEQRAMIFRTIREFLAANDIPPMNP